MASRELNYLIFFTIDITQLLWIIHIIYTSGNIFTYSNLYKNLYFWWQYVTLSKHAIYTLPAGNKSE